MKEQSRFLSEELNAIKVEIVIDSEEKVFIDQQQVERVFINLFLNAKAALLETLHPRIGVKIWREKKKVKLSFSDNGKGIQPQDQNKIFIPFYTSKMGGKGIGLTLCRQLMRNNGGRMSLRKSEKGETVFELTFNSY